MSKTVTIQLMYLESLREDKKIKKYVDLDKDTFRSSYSYHERGPTRFI